MSFSPRRIRAASSWVLSAAGHAAAALLLLLIAVQTPQRPDPALILSRVTLPPTELLTLSPSILGSGFSEPGAPRINNRPLAASVPKIAAPTGSRAGFDQLAGGNTGTGGTGSGKRGTTFMGTSAGGDRFVFIIDVSRSMHQRGRLGTARFALKSSVAELDANQSFSVLLFSDETRIMFHEPQARLVRATSENQAKLAAWIARAKPRGGTNPRAALKIALHLRPDAIFLLSDGAFEDDDGDPAVQSIPDLIRQHNVGQVPVHTIAFADRSSRANMAEVAALTGGRFRFVAQEEIESSHAYEEQYAARFLALAEHWEKSGRVRRARKLMESIARDFPDTEAAQRILRPDD